MYDYDYQLGGFPGYQASVTCEGFASMPLTRTLVYDPGSPYDVRLNSGVEQSPTAIT